VYNQLEGGREPGKDFQLQESKIMVLFLKLLTYCKYFVVFWVNGPSSQGFDPRGFHPT